MDSLEQANGSPHSDKLDSATRGLMDLVELQLCGIGDHYTGSGAVDSKYLGRGDGLKVVRRPATPITKNEYGAPDSITLGLLWLRVAIKFKMRFEKFTSK